MKCIAFLALMVASFLSCRQPGGLNIHWKEDILTISGEHLPGKKMDILYLEAFCKTGSTNRIWEQTTIAHKTELVSADMNGKVIKLHTLVQPSIEVLHEIRAGNDEVDFQLELKNNASQAVDVDWFQPCIRVDRFTNRSQENYLARCFIFTDRGLTTLDKTRRTEDALYKGGQTYVPAGINMNDVNPRPISNDQPATQMVPGNTSLSPCVVISRGCEPKPDANATSWFNLFADNFELRLLVPSADNFIL